MVARQLLVVGIFSRGFAIMEFESVNGAKRIGGTTMTGRASAELICKAKVCKPDSDDPRGFYDGYCGQVTRPDLIDNIDGYYFEIPEGWHVELSQPANEGYHCEKSEKYPDGWYPGHPPTETIVRCPEHCELITEETVEFGTWRVIRTDTHWEDAP